MAQAYKEMLKARLPLQSGVYLVLARYGHLRHAWVIFACRTWKALACGSVFQVSSFYARTMHCLAYLIAMLVCAFGSATSTCSLQRLKVAERWHSVSFHRATLLHGASVRTFWNNAFLSVGHEKQSRSVEVCSFSFA